MSLKPIWIVDAQLTELHKRPIVVARFKTTREAQAWLKDRGEPGFGVPDGRYTLKDTTHE